MAADRENITGRDRYIICKALAYAIASIDARAPEQRDLSERADMVALFHALCPGPEMRELLGQDEEAHTRIFLDLTAKLTDNLTDWWRRGPATRRYHAGMHTLPKPGYEPKTIRAVAMAYRRERQAGRLDEPAREAAMKVFHARYPALDRRAASEAVAQIIAWAAQEHPDWFWKSVSLPERR